MVYEADSAGTLTEIIAQEGDTLPIGEVIARIGDAGDAPAPSDNGASADRGATTAEAGREPEEGTSPSLGRRLRRVLASMLRMPPRTQPPPPRAARPCPRRWRAHQGVAARPADRLREGAGSGGALGLGARRADREGGCGEGRRRCCSGGCAERLPAPSAPVGRRRSRRRRPRGRSRSVELTKLQQTVARRMAESKATAPHFYLQADIDMTRAFDARAQIKAAAAEGDVVPSFNDMVVKACAIALRERPAGQRRLQGRQARAVLARQRRRRGRRAGRARRPDRLRRRPQGPAPDRHRDPRPRRPGARGDDHPAGALRRNLHRVQPRHVRDLQLPRRDQPAAGGDPRRRRDHADPGRPRRRDHGRRRSWASPSPATTASSTAPTAPSSSAASARCSRSRWGWPSSACRPSG